MKCRVTIKDVAKIAGVSHPTVSRVIHGGAKVHPETRQRILSAMNSLGYTPNLIARGLVSRSTHMIAVIVPDFNPHIHPIVRGIAEECRRNDYAFMIFSTENWTDENSSYLTVVDRWQVDGVLIYSVNYRKTPASDESKMGRHTAPFAFINKYLRTRSVNAAGVDTFAAVKLAVDHLVGLGHTRIGALNGSLDSVDGYERKQAFHRALESRGIGCDPAWCGDADFSRSKACREMRRILRMPHPPTALFCANDLMALGACCAARDEGLRVPNDLSIVGYDDIEAGSLHQPALTTIRPPLREIGAQATALLMDSIRTNRTEPRQIVLPARLIVRKSTGPFRLSPQ